MEMTTILLPFDDSASSINAAHYALNLAKQMKAKVSIIYCYEWNPSITEVPSPLIKDLDKVCKQKAEDTLKIAEEIFRDRGVEYSTEAVFGAPGRVLPELAKSKRYDLIIMGSRGHSDIAGMLLGSVTHKVLSNIYCPVLVVP